MRYDNLPFGKPDAAEKGLKDLSDTVDVGDLMPSFSLHNDPTVVRILVGRKGTGKTHALKLLEDASRRKGNKVQLRHLDVDLTHYRFVAGLSSASGFRSNWERIWRFALAAAALSRFSCREPDEDAAEALASAGVTREEIRADWQPFAIECHSALDPVGALIDLIGNARNAETLANIVMDARLEDLERFVASLMRRAGPVHYLLDGFDEFEEANPRVWLDIQLGLFWLSFRLNTTRQHLRGVYLTVAVREGVLTAAQGSQHADRFDYGASIMLLSWSREAAVAFFRSILWKIRNKPFWKHSRIGEREPEADWLGRTEFRLNRPESERLIDYLVRHTRCTPRDLISVGNRIATTLNHASDQERRNIRLIDYAVRAASHEIANKALKAATEDLIRDERFIDFSGDLTDEPKRKSAFEFLRRGLHDLVAAVAAEVVEAGTFRKRAVDVFDSILPDSVEDPHVEAILLALWRNGVVADQVKRRKEFAWNFIWTDSSVAQVEVPQFCAKIGFHPSMFEIARLRRSRLGPVY